MGGATLLEERAAPMGKKLQALLAGCLIVGSISLFLHEARLAIKHSAAIGQRKPGLETLALKLAGSISLPPALR